MILKNIFTIVVGGAMCATALFSFNVNAQEEEGGPTVESGFGVQAAWTNPSANLGVGQTKPGYSRVNWEPGSFIPVRLRDGMTTLINFPDWEKIKDAYIGDKDFFDGRPISKNTFMITPIDGRAMADTNLTIIGDSGNKYIFYLKSEPVNTDTTTNMEVDIIVPTKYRKGSAFSGANGGGNAGVGGLKSIGSGSSSGNGSNANNAFMLEGEDFGWIKTIPVDPTEFRFDLDVFVPNPDDYIIAPERVWRDQVFTYIDFGEKAIYMTQRPTAAILTENGEGPVGFRTEGPFSRLLVIEAVGDIVLRSGQRIVCIKKRGAPFLLSQPPQPFMVPGLPDDSVAMANTYGNGATYQNPLQMGAPISNANMVSGGHAPVADPSFNGYAAGYNGVVGGGNGYVYSGAGENNAENFNGQKTKNLTNAFVLPDHYVPIVKQSKISFAVELVRGKTPKELDEEWYKIQNAFEFLKEFTPYYSVETKGVDELSLTQYKGNEFYRLRIGPFGAIEEADGICRKLAAFNTPCNVVRIQ
ncbi:MAG: TrbG/VirB9 family P-type conjugative transfer protein [Rickettsiales bacterium]|jgi:ComB9 competence protein|nr:TrbG/VirB9 family P-type conjugative transfer protein [Rickettsiales bacterium]